MSFIFLVLGIGGLLIAAAMAKLGIVLLRADPLEAEKNAARSKSFREAIRGRVRIKSDWLPDARVAGGMVYNKKLKRIEVCGRISDDSIDRTFR